MPTMLQRFRAILLFAPRIWIALFLALTFYPLHLTLSHYAKSQQASAKQDYEQRKSSFTFPEPNESSKLYAKAVELIDKPLQKRLETALFFDLLSIKPDADRLETFKLIFESSGEIRKLLHDARVNRANSLGAIPKPQIQSLIALCVDSAFYCIETGDRAQAAEILLDALHFDRLILNNISLLFTRGWWQINEPQIQLCIRRLGMRLTPDDGARDGVTKLIAALLDESYALYSYTYMVDSQRRDYDIYRGKFPLVEPLLSIQNAQQIRMILDNIHQIETHHYDRTMQLNYITAHPHPPLHTDWKRMLVTFMMPQDIAAMNLSIEPAINRMTALALACQLHRVDHNAWPTRLDQLAPKYIRDIPPANFPIQIMQLKFTPGFDRVLLAAGNRQDLLTPAYYGNSMLDIIGINNNFADLIPFPTDKADMVSITPIALEHQP